jgi:hypothetical protein
MPLDVEFKGTVGTGKLAALGKQPQMIDFKSREGLAGVKLVCRSPNRDA